ncbi:MAG TPA: prepilin-type N-terminal cleavage/methylation domain-containing protein, partial [Candidatus Limnocylindria bacterium]|nr:prepilin-type N-terminal cleavage/methylation domain-containing protein [Candidatus Limnocylindria bacterium]
MNGRPRARFQQRDPGRAFTLIELMVAIALGALMMMIAIPALRASQKPPLVRATNDLLEACREARSRAVLTGRPFQVIFVVLDNTDTMEMRVEPAPLREFESIGTGGETTAPAPGSSAAGEITRRPMFHAEFPEDVSFRYLAIDRHVIFDAGVRGQQDAGAAAIRFYPNGTSAELIADLDWRHQEVRHLTSELITGQV